jgi:hypothetical protein
MDAQQQQQLRPPSKVTSGSRMPSALRDASNNRALAEKRRQSSPSKRAANAATAGAKKTSAATASPAPTDAPVGAAAAVKPRRNGPEVGAALLGQMAPQHRDAARLLYRDFCQHVRFGSSVAMNRGKCEGFLSEYGLQPSAKQTDHLLAMLLEDVHNVESVFNAAKSPKSASAPRASSPAKRKGIFSTSAPCGLHAFVDALRWLAVRRKAPLAQGDEADALPPVRALAQLLDSTVLPKLERKVEPRLWKALRRARAATEAAPVLRLLLSANRSPLEKLFAAYQLQGSKSRTDTTVSEEQFNTLLARLGVQGPWLSKHDISQALWLVKTWSGSSSGDGAHPQGGKASAAAAQLEVADTVSALEFRRCLTLAVALNFDEEGESDGASELDLCTGFRALLKQLEHSSLGQQLGFTALEPKEAQLAQAQAQAQAAIAAPPPTTKKKSTQPRDDASQKLPAPSPSRQSRPNPFVSPRPPPGRFSLASKVL